MDLVKPSFSNCQRLQELAPKYAHLCIHIANFIKNTCKISLEGKKLLLAVSGGADSTALLFILNILRPMSKHSLMVMYINHGLRQESNFEAESIAKLCAAWDIECIINHAPVKEYAQDNKIGLEESGRLLRYGLLEEQREKNQCAYIVTGHHREDLAEDQIMRFVRGTGWPALAGMKAIDEKRHLLRPLLHTDPQILKELLKQYDIYWHEDISNTQTNYTRNHIRNLVMPLLKEKNPSLHNSVLNLWELASADDEHFQTIITKAIQKYDINLNLSVITLPYALLNSLDRSIRLRLYLYIIKIINMKSLDNAGGKKHSEKSVQGKNVQARAKTLFQIDGVWLANIGGKYFKISKTLEIYIKNKAIIFTKS